MARSGSRMWGWGREAAVMDGRRRIVLGRGSIDFSFVASLVYLVQPSFLEFVARLPGVTPPLLAAPLSLALESIRGMPTLKLLGTIKLSPGTACLDTEIDVPPRVLALETQYIPERTLLRSPHPHPHIDPCITSTAVRIGLGEDVIVVYVRLQSEEFARVEREGVGKLELVAARLLDLASQSDSDDDSDEDMEEDLPEGTMFAVPPPTQHGPRPPRPDPLPREPPTRAILIRVASGLDDREEVDLGIVVLKMMAHVRRSGKGTATGEEATNKAVSLLWLRACRDVRRR